MREGTNFFVKKVKGRNMLQNSYQSNALIFTWWYSLNETKSWSIFLCSLNQKLGISHTHRFFSLCLLFTNKYKTRELSAIETISPVSESVRCNFLCLKIIVMISAAQVHNSFPLKRKRIYLLLQSHSSLKQFLFHTCLHTHIQIFLCP